LPKLTRFSNVPRSFAALFFAALIFFSSAPRTIAVAYAATDEYIFADPVSNIYTGRPEASLMIQNLNFADVPAGFWAKDAITRAGALNLVKGDSGYFNPGLAVTNEEAIAFALRALGQENAAQAMGAALLGQLPANSALVTVWSLGYLNLAQNIGLITPADFADAMVPDQTALDPTINFIRGGAAARERVADWLYRALSSANPAVFPARVQQGIYTANDWQNISPQYADAVETLIQNNVLPVYPNGNFDPKGTISRAEMAQTLANLDGIYYNFAGILKKTGTVGGVGGDYALTTGSGALSRDIYVRTERGGVDILRYGLASSTSPQSGSLDAVVFRGGEVAGLESLMEGDRIEYLVSPANGIVLYVQVTQEGLSAARVRASLQSVDFISGTITVSADGDTFSFPMAGGLFGVANGVQFVRFGSQKLDIASLPYGSGVELRLKNNIVDYIAYVGEPMTAPETRGIVTENDPSLGFLTVIDPEGRQVTKAYYESGLKVRKKEYYDMSGEASYIGRVFPDYEYDPLEADISAIEPGDIVFFTTDPDDPHTITYISAAANCSARYGKILEFSADAGLSRMLVEFENKQTSWYDMTANTRVSKNGAPIGPSDVRPGDWASILINQALIGPGYVMESVKEMTVEGGGHNITEIIKGQFAGIDAVQNRLIIKNAQTLTKAGWGGNTQIKTFDISGGAEYYSGGTRVSADYAANSLKHADMDVYIALEDNYAGARVKKVTFRSGRDELLNPDTVLDADGNGNFRMLSNAGPISADDGSIIVRDGRLITGRGVMPADYATVCLNGQNTAAVALISSYPDAEGVYLARGRVLSADGGKSFKVQSMSSLYGNTWQYTPIQREFAIDGGTVFMNASGPAQMESFTDFTGEPAIDKVYNVVVDGSRASRVVDSPFANKPIRGVVYQASDNILNLKNVTCYDDKTGKWLPISGKNPTASVSIPANAIVVKNNSIVGIGKIEPGDQLKIMTDALPEQPAAGMSVTGYIVLTEK